MSMFDLNGADFKEREVKRVFNNGKGGKVKNVIISKIEKKSVEDDVNAPDYKIFFEDENGSDINLGFWKEAKDDAGAKRELGRLLHIARAVLGADYKFPPVASYTEGVNVLSKLVKDNFKGKVFNLFVSYGNENYPKKFLTIRYFDFLESADTEEVLSKLFVKKNDLLEPLEDDSTNDTSDDLLAGDSDLGDDITDGSDLDDDNWA